MKISSAKKNNQLHSLTQLKHVNKGTLAILPSPLSFQICLGKYYITMNCVLDSSKYCIYCK